MGGSKLVALLNGTNSELAARTKHLHAFTIELLETLPPMS